MMLPIEEVLRELEGEDVNEQGLPPGFRFHPTDEELITFYLASKVFNGSFCGVQIAEVDLNRCEPWELPDGGERVVFFSLRDRKYPTGLRTNRATGAGYWKATGKDREVYSASNGALLGMKKTLVFYKGRAPRGLKTKWVMHEYRLAGDFSYRISSKEEWVICRIYHKSVDKKISIVHDQEAASSLRRSSSSSSTQLPPLLESPTTLPEYQVLYQNPFLISQQENDVKSQINAVMSQSNLFPINGFFQFQFQPSISSLNKGPSDYINNNYSSAEHQSSSSFSALLSHQDCNTIKESGTSSSSTSSIPKQCKTEANFYHFEMMLNAAAPSLHYGDNIHHQQPNPLFFDMDGNNSTIITTNTNTNSLQMMLDQPMTISGESSCPLGI